MEAAKATEPGAAGPVMQLDYSSVAALKRQFANSLVELSTGGFAVGAPKKTAGKKEVALMLSGTAPVTKYDEAAMRQLAIGILPGVISVC